MEDLDLRMSDMTTSSSTPKGALLKRSVMLNGHATSVALEPEFWRALDQWSKREEISTAQLISRLDKERGETGGSLASTLRVASLKFAARNIDLILENGDA